MIDKDWWNEFSRSEGFARGFLVLAVAGSFAISFGLGVVVFAILGMCYSIRDED